MDQFAAAAGDPEGEFAKLLTESEALRSAIQSRTAPISGQRLHR
jgi:hypothetical protein